MASGPLTSWQINGEALETVTDFIFLCSKVTADHDSSHETKIHLLLGRKAMTNLDSVLKKQKHHFPTKVCMVIATVFPVVMYQTVKMTDECPEKPSCSIMNVNLFQETKRGW